MVPVHSRSDRRHFSCRAGQQVRTSAGPAVLSSGCSQNLQSGEMCGTVNLAEQTIRCSVAQTQWTVLWGSGCISGWAQVLCGTPQGRQVRLTDGDRWRAKSWRNSCCHARWKKWGVYCCRDTAEVKEYIMFYDELYERLWSLQQRGQRSRSATECWLHCRALGAPDFQWLLCRHARICFF